MAVIPNQLRDIAINDNNAMTPGLNAIIWNSTGIKNIHTNNNISVADRPRIVEFIRQHSGGDNVLTYWFANNPNNGAVVPVNNRLIYRTNGTSYRAPRARDALAFFANENERRAAGAAAADVPPSDHRGRSDGIVHRRAVGLDRPARRRRQSSTGGGNRKRKTRHSNQGGARKTRSKRRSRSRRR